MAVKVFDNAKKEQDIYLKLTPDPFNEGVRVIAIRADGKAVPSGVLLSINPDGIILHTSVADEVPIKKDTSGKLNIR